MLGVLFGDSAIRAIAQEKNPDPSFAPAQLAERTLHRRAVEAIIWGMPAVKPVSIAKFIGRRPVLACSNSDGDLQML